MKLVNKIKISLLISMFVVVLLNVKAFATTGVITEITVNVRERASKDSKRIMYVTQDDKVEVLEKDGDWYKIKAKGKTGYIFGTYVKVDDSELENNTSSSDNNETKTDENSKEQNSNTENNEKTTDVETKKYLKSKSELKIIPNISSNVIYTTSNDMVIDIIEETGKWTYISADNIFGWVKADNIFSKEEKKSEEVNSTTENTDNKTEETKNEVNKTAYIKYDTVNLRKTASTSSKVLAKLKLNDEVTIIQDVNSIWYKVEVDGKTGYISKELLTDSKQDKKENETKNETTSSRSGESGSREEKKDTSTNSEKEENANKTTSTSTSSNNSLVTGEKVVAYAKEYLGYKYTYGGSTPKTGFDCSGFTSYVYKNFGYSLSRSSSGQSNNGTKVSKEDLQVGDILIFKNQSLTKIGHVGIYVGDNKIIHASEPGVGVTITDLDAKGYNYNKRFVMARRIIK